MYFTRLCVEAVSCLETVLRETVRVLCVVLGPHDALAATCPAQKGDIFTPQVL